MTERNIFIDAFPEALKTEINSLLDKLNWATSHTSTECFQINYNGEILNIPYRIYYDEPIPQNLTDSETFLLNSILTRHHNGYIREKGVVQILKSDNYLITPFIALLLGEYLLEILTVINDNLSSTQLDNLVKFKADNPKFFNTTEQRVQSYWNCYYNSSVPNKADYAGFQILEAIKNKEQDNKKGSV